MAATNVLSAAKTANNSSDFTTTGPATVALKVATPPLGAFTGGVKITLKDDTGVYQDVAYLHAGSPQVVLIGPGTYRAEREVCSVAVGVFLG